MSSLQVFLSLFIFIYLHLSLFQLFVYRTQLPPNLLNNPIILPPSPPPTTTIIQQRNAYNSFHTQNNLFSTSSRPEDPVLPWTPQSNESIQSSLQNSQIQVTCTPEM